MRGLGSAGRGVSDATLGSCARLDQVPPIPVEILEHYDGTVGLLTWALEEPHTSRTPALVVLPEGIGLQEQEDAATRLVPDPRQLLRCRRARQEDAGTRAAGFAARPDSHPSLNRV